MLPSRSIFISVFLFSVLLGKGCRFPCFQKKCLSDKCLTCSALGNSGKCTDHNVVYEIKCGFQSCQQTSDFTTVKHTDLLGRDLWNITALQETLMLHLTSTNHSPNITVVNTKTVKTLN